MSSKETTIRETSEPKSDAVLVKNQNAFFESEDANRSSKKKSLPPWLDHFNAKDLKVLFKSAVAVWIVTLFWIIDPILKAEGQAAFFGCLVLFILPASGIALINLMAGATMIVGMALGWAWGTITMKAALATRPQAETNARLAQLQQQASQSVPNSEQASGQSAYTQILIFDGFMLDTRITMTYFCMMGLFIYLVARLRVAAPKLALLQIFAIIVADIYLTTAPLIPSFSGTIPQTLIKPAAIGIGVGVVCNLLIFPESTSHIVLDEITDILTPMIDFCEACRSSFGRNSSRMSISNLETAKANVTGKLKSLEANFGFLAIDMSTCRWSTDDIDRLKLPLRQVVVTFMSLVELQIRRRSFQSRQDEFQESLQTEKSEDSHKVKPKFGQHQLSQLLSFAKRLRHPEHEKMLGDSMAALQTSSNALMQSCAGSIGAVLEVVRTVNEHRWFGRPNQQQCSEMSVRHSDVLESLREHQKEFELQNSQRLLDPHNHLFDEEGHLTATYGSSAPPVQGLMLGLLFEERIIDFANALEGLLAQIVALEKERDKTRFWFPSKLTHLAGWAVSKEDVSMSPNGALHVDDKQPKSKRRTRKSKKSKDNHNATGEQTLDEQLAALKSRRGRDRSKIGQLLFATAHWFSSTEGIYALRVLVVTIGLGVPAVIRSSAGFYYREKGLWALIMAQTGLVTYTADFIYGLILRTIGTILGGVIGMICWYIGAGSGPGNHYGMAAIMAVAIVVLMWGRLFAPPDLLQAIIITAATLYLVVSYSWVDTHIPSYGNPGVGYAVFWRRVLLVMVGFFAAALVTLLPRPPSASRHYRRIIGESIDSFRDLYALLVVSWSKPSHHDRSALQKRAITIHETLSSIQGPLKLIKYEYSSSDFSADGLTKITKICITINSSIFQLLYYSSVLPEQLRERLSVNSGILDERFVAELMAVLTLFEQSIRTGQPLPSVLPCPLIVRIFQQHAKATDLDKEQHSTRPLDKTMILDKEFRKYCVALSSLTALLGAVDDLCIVLKEELGETSLIEGHQWTREIV